MAPTPFMPLLVEICRGGVGEDVSQEADKAPTHDGEYVHEELPNHVLMAQSRPMAKLSLSER